VASAVTYPALGEWRLMAVPLRDPVDQRKSWEYDVRANLEEDRGRKLTNKHNLNL
jgi:hypothetical protein